MGRHAVPLGAGLWYCALLAPILAHLPDYLGRYKPPNNNTKSSANIFKELRSLFTQFSKG